MNKSFHNFLMGVSVLPALVVAPAMADSAMGFIDDYVASVIDQTYDVLVAQNNNGFQIGSITVGNNMSAIDTNDGSLRYGVSTRDAASQYVKMEQVGLPAGVGAMYLDMPVYNVDGEGLRDNVQVGSLTGLSEINLMSWVLNTDTNKFVEYEDGNAVSVTPHIENARSLLAGLINQNMLGDRTWFLSAVNHAMETGKIEDGYLYTDGNFTVDGQYGNMATTLFDTYEGSLSSLLDAFSFETVDEMNLSVGNIITSASGFGTSMPDESKAQIGYLILRDAFGITDEKAAQLVAMSSDDRNAILAGYLDAFAAKMTQLNSLNATTPLKLDVGEIAMNGGNVTFKNNVDITTSNLAVSAGNIVVDSGATNITIGNVSLNFAGQYVPGWDNEDPVTSSSVANYTAGSATLSGGEVTVNSGAALTVAGTELNVANGATVINNGTLNVNTSTAAFNGDVSGNGTLVVGQDTTLNIGTSSITQGTITLNGTMLATLREGDSQLNATTAFDGTGTLKLIMSQAGTYNVFGGETFGNLVWDESGITTSSDVYDLVWNGGVVTAQVKSAEKIAEDNGVEQDVAAAVVGLNQSTSEKLKDLGIQMQEKLAEGTPEAKEEVEHIAKAINPETESVVQSVATSVQTTVANLASARMATPVAGRNAGDVDLTSGGVWAQGLYNKSKKDDAFDGSTRGIALGVDGTINKDWMVGAGYSYADSDINGTERDTDIKSNTVFLYGQYKPAEWYVNAVLNYTWSEYSEESSLATADYDVTSFGGAIATGYDFESGVTPELGLRYMHINGETYTDSLDISKKMDSADYLTVMLGAKYGFDVAADEDMLFRPEVRAAVKYDIVSDKTLATVTMPGAAAYTLDGDRLSRIGGEFGIGLTMNYKELDVSLNYDIEVREDYTSQTGMLKFRYNF